MKFTLSSTTLSTKLGILSKVIMAKNAMPILEGFLFEVSDGQLVITASDNENVMKSTCQLSDSDGNGRFVVSSHTILDAVRELPDQPLTFEVDLMDFTVKVYYQNGNYNFTVQNADEYPQTQALPSDVTTINFEAGVLQANITRKFVDSSSGLGRINKLIEQQADVLSGGGTLIRLTYNKDCVGDALISEVSRRYGVNMNILLGSLELLQGSPLGGLVVLVEGSMDARREAIAYLCEHNVIVEVIEHG